MAGHSHWANIKRQKGKNDAKRGKVWSKIARKIIIAAKGGGGNPDENLALRYIVDEAKAANMPKDTIANAIKKGTGELGGDNYEAVTYEGYGPGGAALMIEALTNNRARTAPDLRAMFERAGGNLAVSGSVAFQFTKAGVIAIKSDAIDEETLMEVALEAGADDVRDLGEVFEVTTPVAAYHKVKDAITAKKIAVENSEITYLPSNTVALDEGKAASLLKLIDNLEDYDDVQSVSHNAELPESVGA
ncbi:MAG TPA: YebC/PmpR family DNA-binding transcriptional regulator [Tepidisphaeraceae bacterium]|jgi:YebC/PmpR family DNA-binding regulatory protein